ncbi:MAG: hypothetical protein OXU27_03480 [Candidatus Poribacteria bacterium]|nr:hypothetical protein [Candidatus Poribacteria bacterium]
MKQNAVKFRILFLLFLFLSFYIHNAAEGAEEIEPETEAGNELVGEMMKGMEDVMADHEKRKKALEELVKKPLTEAQQKLLRQLSKNTGALDDILSSEPYLAYLKSETGKTYKDFLDYVAVMPTPKQKTKVLFSLKEALPPNTKAKALSICTDYYFKLRSLLVKEPDILGKTNALVAFQTKNLMEPLMGIYSAEELFSHISELTQMSMVSTLTAQTDTEVFHDAWRERLEKHGSSEGLLRCAIATPADFALVRSFFEDSAAFEKWIQTSLKTEAEPEEKKEKTDE